VPVVWTLHDMNPFTGGCHYSGPCDRYQARCGACPQLKTSEGDHDMTRGIWERKREIYGRIPPHRLTLVCPSRWLAHEARLSSLCREFDVRVIPNGIDLHDYHPVSQTHAREQLGLPPGARIVLFVAEQIEDRRKGLGFLLEAFDAVRNIPDLLLVTLGTSNNSLLTGPRFRHLGSMATSAQLRVAYSAADVFVIPSLQDNLPNTLIESMACGTPVVGFAAGGISEAVINGRTGLLAPPGDVAALAANLRRALEDGLLRRALAGESLFRVEQEYTIQRQARRYAALYHEILRAPRPSAAPAHPIP
jgi:glycosyltransferase involved in cell wall biosynthesis